MDGCRATKRFCFQFYICHGSHWADMLNQMTNKSKDGIIKLWKLCWATSLLSIVFVLKRAQHWAGPCPPSKKRLSVWKSFLFPLFTPAGTAYLKHKRLPVYTSIRISMAGMWNFERGDYLHEMSSHGERTRYLYSKMCCAGEWWDSIYRTR